MTSRTHDGGDAPAWCDLKHTLHRAFRYFEVANQCATYRERHRCVSGVRLVAYRFFSPKQRFVVAMGADMRERNSGFKFMERRFERA